MDCLTPLPLLNLSPETRYRIVSCLTDPRDVLAYRLSCKQCSVDFSHSKMVCVRIRRGFVYGVLQQYLLGTVTSEVLAPFVEAVSLAPDSERERLLKGFRLHYEKLIKKIDREDDFKAFLPFFRLWVMSKSIEFHKGAPRPPLVAFTIKWILAAPSRLDELVRVLHEDFKKKPSRQYSDFLNDLLVGLCAKNPKNIYLLDETKESVSVISNKSHREPLPLYFAYLERKKLKPYLKLAANQTRFCHMVLIPWVLKKDRLRWLGRHMGEEALKSCSSTQRLMNKSYLMGKTDSFEYAKSLLGSDDKTIVEALLSGHFETCSDLLTSLEWTHHAPSPWHPLSLALDLHLWFEAFDLLPYLPRDSLKAKGASKILSEFLRSGVSLTKKRLKQFTKKLLSFSYCNEDRRRIVYICFLYRHAYSQKIVASVEASCESPTEYGQVLMDSLLCIDKSHRRYFIKFVWRRFLKMPEKEPLIFHTLKKLLSDATLIHAHECKVMLVNRLFLLLTPSKRYDVMLMPNAGKYLDQGSFFFPTLSINTQKLPPEETGGEPNEDVHDADD